jgi:predicted alpha/beta hydrolase family esterase
LPEATDIVFSRKAESLLSPFLSLAKLRMDIDKSIYLLPGKGGRLNQGLGKELHVRGYDVFGRETIGEFRKLPFREQIEIVANDLKADFWHEDAKVIANSFGAYLFLHAQMILKPYIGRILLLSPIIGEASNEEMMMFFVPPAARRLQDAVASSAYPAPARCEIYVGQNDWQSNPENIIAMGKLLNFKVTVVPKNGHMLDRSYVGGVLNEWLVSPNTPR